MTTLREVVFGEQGHHEASCVRGSVIFMHMCCLILFVVTALVTSGYASHMWPRPIADKLSVSQGEMRRAALPRTGNPGKSSLPSYVSVPTEEKRGEERHMLHDFPKQHKCTVKALISFGTVLALIMLSHTFLCVAFKPQ